MDDQEHERYCYDLQYDRIVVKDEHMPKNFVKNDGSLTEDGSQLAISEMRRASRIYERRNLLNELSKETKAVNDDIDLKSRCLQYLRGRFGDDATTFPGDILYKENQKRKDGPREEHLLCERLWQATMDNDLAVSAIKEYSRLPISRLPMLHLSSTILAGDIVLLRIHKTDSNSPYHPGLGLFCGNWKAVPFIHDPAYEDFYNHMNNNRPPTGTPYISFHESPSKLITLQEYPGYRNSANRVLAYSLNALKRLGMEVTRTTDLLAKTPYSKYTFEGDGENFVHYVHDSHWLVQYWASEEAKLADMSLNEFRGLAVKHNIINKDGSYPDIAAYTISKDAFVEHERQRLSNRRSTSEVTGSLVGLEIV
ncbi:hypothetical protein BGZ57DRAFT_1010464 [Hyaloscypha finlandica]|nr:hypothetical protein BGZ57DRAFT_1010464 [Hyaloscypha finlandica]